MELNVEINGEARRLEIKPGAVLVDVLRENGLRGTKTGCREGHCGSCMVLLDGQAVNACLLLAARCQGRRVTTIEGLSAAGVPHPIQEAFVEGGIVQCGYCTPGMVISTKALLDQNPDPSEEEIAEALSGNLCRCTGYTHLVEAVKLAAQKVAALSEVSPR